MAVARGKGPLFDTAPNKFTHCLRRWLRPPPRRIAEGRHSHRWSALNSRDSQVFRLDPSGHGDRSPLQYRRSARKVVGTAEVFLGTPAVGTPLGLASQNDTSGSFQSSALPLCRAKGARSRCHHVPVSIGFCVPRGRHVELSCDRSHPSNAALAQLLNPTASVDPSKRSRLVEPV
jgi:hypothetical protein